MINKYSNFLSDNFFQLLIYYNVDWNIDLINNYVDKWNWNNLSKKLPITLEIFETFEAYWNWDLLLGNEFLLNSINGLIDDELIEEILYLTNLKF